LHSNRDLPKSQEEALILGSKRYFNGLPCVHGHVAPRYTSNYRCTVCSRELRKPQEKVKKIDWGSPVITIVAYEERSFEAPFFEGVKFAWKIEYPSGSCCVGSSSEGSENLYRRLKKTADRYKEHGMSTSLVPSSKEKKPNELDDLEEDTEPLPEDY
jgi:hypothetical protein